MVALGSMGVSSLAAVQARHHGLLHSRLLQAEALLRRPRVLPRIEQLIIRAGQRAQDVERAAAAEQAAAEGSELAPLLGRGWHSGRAGGSGRGSRGSGHCCSSGLPDCRRPGHGSRRGHGRRSSSRRRRSIRAVLLSGNEKAASSSEGEFQDIRTLEQHAACSTCAAAARRCGTQSVLQPAPTPVVPL